MSDFKSISQSIKKRDFQPVYLLHGAETFFIDKLTKQFEESVLSEAEKAFNFTVLYGKEVDFKQVLDNARRFPMMAEYQLVILKEAQEMRTLSNLKVYLEKPSPTTIFVVCYKHKKLAMNTSIGKAFKKHATVFESKKLYDNQVPQWVNSYLKEKGFSIESAASELVSEYVGTNLGKLSNELDKLTINLEKGTSINANHVQDNIGISKEYNIFELQNALSVKNVEKVFRIIFHFNTNPKKNNINSTIPALYSFFSKVLLAYPLARQDDMTLAKGLGLFAKNSYSAKFQTQRYKDAIKRYPKQRTEEIFEILREYDLKSKGLGYSSTGKKDGELLKELMFKILN